MAAKNSKSMYLVVLLLFVGGVGYLLFSGLSQNSVYFVDVAEAMEMTPEKLGSARLFGTVKAEGITRLSTEERQGVRFFLVDQHDKEKAMTVEFYGAVPDTFKAGAEVIVEGAYTPDGAQFAARTLMTKCPSKYQKENRT